VAGYSGRRLADKLGIKRGSTVVPLNSPTAYRTLVGELPEDVVIGHRVSAESDIVHLFAVKKAELTKRLRTLRAALPDAAALWVSWPKKAAKMPTDVTEDTIRDLALPLGFVDVKVCAVNDVWSGLKLVIRRENRRAARPTTIDEYLAAVSGETRAALEGLRKIIRAAAPRAEECISYQLPAFRLDGRMLVWFGATANHCAFYPGAVVEEHKGELRKYDTSKGTIRFQPDKPLPAALIRKLVKARIAKNATRPRPAVRR
jgi:uncharacterized protein YdhG (YjbR/CyaY superfamily)